MGGGQDTILINVTPENFFKVLTDYENYPEFVSTVRHAEIVHRNNSTVDVFMELDLIKTITYTLEMHEEPVTKLSWNLKEGDFFKVNSGSWELEPAANGKKTRATYKAEVDLSLFVPKMITKKLVNHSLPKNMQDFKARAEELYG
jgi:ribosome-associated toxin RatA of RatAB toxin-antitoxin module